MGKHVYMVLLDTLIAAYTRMLKCLFILKLIRRKCSAGIQYFSRLRSHFWHVLGIILSWLYGGVHVVNHSDGMNGGLYHLLRDAYTMLTDGRQLLDVKPNP